MSMSNQDVMHVYYGAIYNSSFVIGYIEGEKEREREREGET